MAALPRRVVRPAGTQSVNPTIAVRCWDYFAAKLHFLRMSDPVNDMSRQHFLVNALSTPIVSLSAWQKRLIHILHRDL